MEDRLISARITKRSLPDKIREWAEANGKVFTTKTESDNQGARLRYLVDGEPLSRDEIVAFMRKD